MITWQGRIRANFRIDDFAYGYDRDSNVLYKDNLLSSANSELYHVNSATSGDNNTAYDPLNRLADFERGTLSSSGNNGAGLDTVASASASQSWNLNAVGDQSSVVTNGTTTTNSTNAKNELTANGGNSLTFDNNGNTLTDENGQTYTYDAWNHQVTAKNSGGTVIADYGYDAQGRRITEANATTTTAVYFSNQWQAIEERVGGTVTRQNVWGEAYVNQLIERDDNSVSGTLGISGSGLGERLYAQQDANWNVTALVDTSGAVVQRMVYSPYGAVTFLNPTTWASTSDSYAQNVLFQGGRFEAATGNYNFQRRDYDPATGTWKEADPAGYVDGASQYDFVQNKPNDSVDPFGTYAINSTWNGQYTAYWLTQDWYHPSIEGTKVGFDVPRVTSTDGYYYGMEEPTIIEDGYNDPELSMEFHHVEGVKVISIAWWTCARRDDTAGVIPYAMDSSSNVTFSASFWGFYITHCEILVAVPVTAPKGSGPNNDCRKWRVGYWDVGSTSVHSKWSGWYLDPTPRATFQWVSPGQGGPFSQ